MQRFDPQRQELQLIALLIAMVMLGPFSIDAYLPVMPDIADDLSAPNAVIQFSIGGFLIGTALGPLVAGPLSDALGRRRLILFGVGGFALAAAGCALVTSGEALVFWRMAQALAGAAAFISGQALLADLYDADRLAQRNSLMMLFISLAPMIAPIFGAWLAGVAGWRMIFWTLFGMAAVVLAVAALRLPETLAPDQRDPFRPGPLARGYASVLTNRVAVLYVLGGAGMTAAFFTYLSGSPFLYIEEFGLSATEFAWIFGAGALLAAAGNAVNIAVVGRFGFRRTLVFQSIGVVTLGALLLCGAYGALDRWAIYLSGLLLMPVQHWMTANTMSGVLAQFDRRRGLASAVAMCLRFAAGALAVWVVGNAGGGQETYGLILFSCLALSGIFVQIAVRQDKG